MKLVNTVDFTPTVCICFAFRIAFSIASALDFLHGYELSHGFLTTEHCLLDESGYVRLCGLGHISSGSPVSRYRWIDSDKTGYFAPEIVDDAKG